MIRRFTFVLFALVGCSSSQGSASPGDTPVGDGGTMVDSGATSDGPAVDDAAPATANKPGKYVHTLTLEGMQREFIVYVPEKARGDKPVPVVFMLHGTSGDGEKFFQMSHWKEKSDAEGIISVYPSALTYCLHEDENDDGDFTDPGEKHVTTKWASGQLGDPAKMPLCTAAEIAALPAAERARADHPLQDDIAYFKSMLEFLGKNYAVDAKRIYATGFSNGGQMTSRLAVEMSDRFAAIAAHAGPMGGGAKASARPMTMVFSVGNIDDRFTPSGTPIPIAEATASGPMFGRITGDYLTTGQLANEYAYDEPKPGIARWTYTKSTIGAKNKFLAVLIDKCTHEYPNGTNHPLVMADALWELFKTESLP